MEQLKEELKQWRHYLHMHPEPAFEETNTAAFVAEKLREMGLSVHTGIGGTGVVAELTCGNSGRTIGLRADMDAIRLQEQGEVPYRSVNDGVVHACGHDGHTVTLLAAARLLSERRNFNGTVRFVFQPAEEPGKGARAMIEDGLFDRFPMDEIYGIHNAPANPFGTLAVRSGGFCSSEDNFKIVIRGRGGHASNPSVVIDPLVIAAQIILALQTIVSRNVPPADSGVISCTEVFSDGAHNAIPSTVTILGDCRSYKKEIQALFERRMREICVGLCAMNGAECGFEYTHEFAPTVNTPEQTQAAAQAAIAVLGAENVDAASDPATFSEDFGLYLEHVPGCFALLGSGTGTPLHNAWFDYNDDLLLVGAEYFAELVRQRLP